MCCARTLVVVVMVVMALMALMALMAVMPVMPVMTLMTAQNAHHDAANSPQLRDTAEMCPVSSSVAVSTSAALS